jgi:hypothetical protein
MLTIAAVVAAGALTLRTLRRPRSSSCAISERAVPLR